MLKKIISGGQTGVDRAALDAAICAGIPIGGYCPRGRLSADGSIPAKYPLIETESKKYRVRTEMNVIESDGTLIISADTLSGGTKLTAEFALRHKRPFLIVHMDFSEDIKEAVSWIISNSIQVMNVAGPRESEPSGDIYDRSYAFLKNLFVEMESKD
ncbi:MAG TPA: hypothetical protein ENN05_02005 [Deltaproteobacteria bacterium]|nr:hypothetical protein [Deltaproteobacteria bacterium]